MANRSSMITRLPALLYCLFSILSAQAEPARDPTTDSYYAANALYNRGLYKLAAEEFQTFLNHHGDHEKASQARRGLALSLYGQKNFQQAEPLLAKLAPQDPEASLLQAHCLLQLGKPKEALNRFEKTLEKSGDDTAFKIRTLEGLTDTLLALENWNEAARQARELIKITSEKTPARLRAHYHLGLALYRDGQPKPAAEELRILRQSVEEKQNPYFSQAALMEGEALRENGELDQAADRFRQASEHSDSPDLAAQALYRLSYLQFQRGQFDQAIDTTRKLTEKFPQSTLLTQATLLAARAALGKNDHSGVRERLQPLLEDPATGAEAAYWLGLSLRQDNHPDQALDTFQKALDRFPEDPRAPDLSFELASTLATLGEPQKALPVFLDLASKKDFPRRADALREAARSHYQLGQFQETLNLCETFQGLAAEGQPHPTIDYLQADSLFRLDQTQKAIAKLEDYLKNHPGHPQQPDALLLLASAYTKTNEPPKAIEALENLLKQNPGSNLAPTALANLGQLRFQAGDPDKAREVLNRLVEKFPDSPQRATGDYYLGFLALQKSDLDQAALWFGEVAARSPDHPLAPDARLQQAIALLGRDGTDDKGIQALQKILEKYPKDASVPDARYRLASARFQRREWEKASQNLEPLLQENPTAQALYLLARTRRELADPGKPATPIYRQLLKENPENDLAPTAAIELAHLTTDPAESISLLEKWIPKLPEKNTGSRSQANLLLARAYLENGDALQAAKSFEAAGDSDAAHLGAGEARLRLDENKKAAEHLEKVGDGPLKTRALIRLGEARARLADWPASTQAYQQVQKNNPEESLARQAQFGLAWAAQNQNELKKAIQLYQEILKTGTRDETAARASFQIGECHFAQGDYDQAIKSFILTDATYPFPEWQARAVLEAGRALEKQGSLQDATARYREVRQRFPESVTASVARDLLKALGEN